MDHAPSPAPARAERRLGAPLPFLCLASLLAAGTALSGCSGDVPAAEASGPSVAEDPAPSAELLQLIEELTPPAAGSTSDKFDTFYLRRSTLLEEMRGAGEAFGLEALAAYRERADAPIAVRSGLLEVAALNVPERTEPILVELVHAYGEDLGLRETACDLLAEVLPARALEVLEPLVTTTRPQETLPTRELLLAAWVRAARDQERDPVPVLARVATNIYVEDNLRARAVEELGREQDDHGRQALETVLVESTGNAYLRRKAAQALRSSLPKDAACAIFERVYEKEADLNFQRFLVDMIEDHCQ